LTSVLPRSQRIWRTSGLGMI